MKKVYFFHFLSITQKLKGTIELEKLSQNVSKVSSSPTNDETFSDCDQILPTVF